MGDGPAAAFVGFLQLDRELPDLDAVRQHPETTPVPREPAVVYALVETGKCDTTLWAVGGGNTATPPFGCRVTVDP